MLSNIFYIVLEWFNDMLSFINRFNFSFVGCLLYIVKRILFFCIYISVEVLF